MKWSVKKDFCADGYVWSVKDGQTYYYYPKLKIETSAELTDDQKTRIVNAMMIAACGAINEIENEMEVANA